MTRSSVFLFCVTLLFGAVLLGAKGVAITFAALAAALLLNEKDSSDDPS